MKYVRKRPVAIEAFQFGVDAVPEWFIAAKPMMFGDNDFCLISKSSDVSIYATGNTYPAHKGDMIIKGSQGEICPCKKDEFDSTYEAMGE